MIPRLMDSLTQEDKETSGLNSEVSKNLDKYRSAISEICLYKQNRIYSCCSTVDVYS